MQEFRINRFFYPAFKLQSIFLKEASKNIIIKILHGFFQTQMNLAISLSHKLIFVKIISFLSRYL